MGSNPTFFKKHPQKIFCSAGGVHCPSQTIPTQSFSADSYMRMEAATSEDSYMRMEAGMESDYMRMEAGSVRLCQPPPLTSRHRQRMQTEAETAETEEPIFHLEQKV